MQVASLQLFPTRYDAETGLPIFHPDSVQLALTLRNIGSDTSEAGDLQLSLVGNDATGFQALPLNQPRLAPGESYHFSGTVRFDRTLRYRVMDDRMSVAVAATGDQAPENNSARSARFHLAAPLLDVTFSTVSYAVAGGVVQLDVIARNYGRHANAPIDTLTACLYAGFTGCKPDYRTTTGTITTPVVPAGAVVRFQTPLSIPVTAAWQDASVYYSMELCDASSRSGDYLIANFYCYAGAGITVQPAYEQACAPATVQPGVTLTLATYNCGLRPYLEGYATEIARFRFHIAALDARAGVTYQIQRSDSSAVVHLYNSGGIAVLDLDPLPNRFQIARDERIYLIQYTPVPSLTLRIDSVSQAGT